MAFLGKQASKEFLLWQAATDGNLEVVRKLSRDAAVNVNWIGPEKGDAPLHRACRFKRLEVLKELMANPRVDVTQVNAVGGTAMSISSFLGDLKTVAQLLADPRVDPNWTTSDGATPFLFAAWKGHSEVVSLLLADPELIPTSQRMTRALPCGWPPRKVTLWLCSTFWPQGDQHQKEIYLQQQDGSRARKGVCCCRKAS